MVTSGTAVTGISGEEDWPEAHIQVIGSRRITRNRERDRQVVRSLKRLGWLVIRVWESDVLKSVE